MNQAGRGRSGGGELVRFPLRWIVLFTGYKATEDYVPAASEGEVAALVKEATDICVAFHPHSEIRLFPKEAMLFWRATTTQDWVVTRVSTAPNPDGIRTALEYSSVVLDEASFRELGYNPFLTRDLQLHEKVRSQFLDRNAKPLWIDVPADKLASAALPDPGLVRPGGSQTASADDIVPGLGNDRIASAENVEKIEKYCAFCSVLQKVPPTFATWWPTGDAPSGYFDVVLHSAPTRSMSLRDASDSVAALGAEITAALPRMPSDDTVASELARSVLVNIDSAQRAISDAMSKLNSETVDQFREHLSSASNSVVQVSANLNLIVKRLDDRISRTDASRLTRLARESAAIGPELVGIRHPNPFAVRPSSLNGASQSRGSRRGRGSSDGDSKPNLPLIVGGIGLLAAIAAGFALLGHHASSEDPVPQAHHNKPHSPSPGIGAKQGNATAPTPASDEGANIALKAVKPLIDAQNSVQEPAKSAAQTEAKKAAVADPAKALSDDQLDKITFAAIKSAYQDKLSPAAFKAAFSGNGAAISSYADLQKNVPDLAASVHEAAHVGASEGQDERKIIAATNSAATAQAQAQASEAKRKDEAVRRTSSDAVKSAHPATSASDTHAAEEPKHTRARAENKPSPEPSRTVAKKSSVSSSAPAKKAPAKSSEPANGNAGSASQTGL